MNQQIMGMHGRGVRGSEFFGQDEVEVTRGRLSHLPLGSSTPTFRPSRGRGARDAASPTVAVLALHLGRLPESGVLQTLPFRPRRRQEEQTQRVIRLKQHGGFRPPRARIWV